MGASRPEKVEPISPPEGVTHPLSADLIGPVALAWDPLPENPGSESKEHSVDLAAHLLQVLVIRTTPYESHQGRNVVDIPRASPASETRGSRS